MRPIASASAHPCSPTPHAAHRQRQRPSGLPARYRYSFPERAREPTAGAVYPDRSIALYPQCSELVETRPTVVQKSNRILPGLDGGRLTEVKMFEMVRNSNTYQPGSFSHSSGSEDAEACEHG